MAQLWQHITPGDSFVVNRDKPQAVDEMTRLILLYQPIIGTDAISLYHSLHSYLSLHIVGYSEPDYHRSLMALMNMSLDRILEAREQLEGIGLIRVRRHVADDETRTYYYQMMPPLTGSDYFSSDVLTVILFHRLGKVKYKEIRSRYLPAVSHVTNGMDLKDMTKGFDVVFKSISPSELIVQPGTESYHILFDQSHEQPSFENSGEDHKGLVITKKSIDFDDVIGRMGRVFQP
ncbi:MAG: hypothetical protein WD907_05225, partial [Bacilli bacterium]